MNRIIVFLFLLYLLPYSICIADSDAFSQGKQYLAQGKNDEALGEFQKVPLKSEKFWDSFNEIQKIYYQNEKWSKFFAYNAFYRSFLFANPGLVQALLDIRPLGLEVLALGRLCRYQDAKLLIEKIRPLIVRFQPMELGLLDEIAQQLYLMENVKNFRSSNADSLTEQILTSHTISWQIDPTKLSQTTLMPQNLEMQVESKCRGVQL